MQGVARTPGRKKVPLLVGCGQRGEQMEPSVVWEELGSHFIDGETGAQRKEELRLEAGACVCVGGGRGLRSSVPLLSQSVAWSGYI